MSIHTLPQQISRHPLSLTIMAALFLLMTPAALAGTKHAAEQNRIRSTDDSIDAEISFINRSGRTIKVYWLDSSGKRVLYKTLKSQQGYTQLTFLTHPWLITDESDNAWYLYYADGQPRTVEIIEPAKH